MKWRYKGQADIIFGEVKPSPVPKIMFVVIISIVVLSSISCFLLRNYLYDLAFNPHIELNLTQENENYYIDLNVNETFDKFAYIDESRTLKYDKFISDENNKYVCEVEGEVDTTHVGEYNIIYKSSNRVKSQEVPVIVRVSDNTPPIIELTKKVDIINRTDESIKTFNPEDYIKSATDNYYDTTIEYHIYDADNNNTEVSKEDIQSMYISLDWLDILPNDVDAYANELIGSDISDEEPLLINEDLYTWGENWLQARDKYKSDIKNQVESNHKYIIEYIITENSKNAYADATQIEFVITFDENSIIDKLNNNKVKLIELGILSDTPEVTEDTKPTGHSGNNNQISDSGNEDNKPSNTGDDKPGNDTGGNQPNYNDEPVSGLTCIHCGEFVKNDEQEKHYEETGHHPSY